MEYNIIRLKFTEPLAIMSAQKDIFEREVSFLDSDKLKAALVAVFAELNSNQEDINSFNEDVLVSNAFPFFKNELFFPKPILKLPLQESENIGEHKVLKKIQYFHQSFFEKILNGEQFSLSEGNLLQNSTMLSKKNLSEINIFRSSIEERVSLGTRPFFDSSDDNADPFYISRTYFNQDSGLFFIYKSKNEKLLFQVLDLLSMNGLGADKNVGNGKFEWSTETLNLNIPEDANGIVTMSNYIPKDQNELEKSLKNASYDIKFCNGFAAGSSQESLRHWAKKNIYMFRTGSFFSTDHLTGSSVDLASSEFKKNAHSLLRDGRPIFFPVKTII